MVYNESCAQTVLCILCPVPLLPSWVTISLLCNIPVFPYPNKNRNEIHSYFFLFPTPKLAF